MLSTLEGIHPDPEIRFTTPQQISISEAKNEARKFMLEPVLKGNEEKSMMSNCQFFSLEQCNKAHWNPERKNQCQATWMTRKEALMHLNRYR
ncbi:hypothetical protein TNIN_38501 [Trichonephila inaurata madagascariensis]|uniref:Uncharacterized protein n=1 Tax=Trichonephila inaurata madagascariensis TaxID=2747483 RepID=A0A8X6Y465_9ARAC|nr:hypothetical protein TNIN_38501 [Trichonephila inaurata madagascariensis]